MRLPTLLAVATTLATLGPAAAAAQDDAEPADTVAAVDSLAVDSLEQFDQLDDSDTTAIPRRPSRGRSGENPYLREVREHRTSERGSAFVSIGAGIGSESISDLGAPAPYSPSRAAPTVSFAIGVNVGAGFRVGIDAFAWFNPSGGDLESVSALMLGGRWYPAPTGGFYVKAAGGLGRYGIDVIDDCGCSTPLVSEYGLAYSIGAGFEFPVGRRLWLGPSVEMVRFNVTGPGGYRERVINFGLTLTYDSPKGE